MKMTLEVKSNTIHGDCGKFAASLAADSVKEKLIPLFYFTMLKAMRDAHTHDFYAAMAIFIEDDEDEMKNFFEGGEDDE